MQENKEQLIKDILMVVIICIVATIFVYQISKAGTESRINIQLRSKISTDSLKMDSFELFYYNLRIHLMFTPCTFEK